MVERLGKGECCVCELMEVPELPKVSNPTISQHLLVLKNAGIIADEKRGKRIFYRLVMPCVANITLCVKERANV
jgi:ArsR family transcriptional regulator